MLKKYLKQRLPILLLFLIFAAIFFAVFALYQVPLEAVLYPLLLCIVMGAGAVVWDYLRACRFHRQMEHIRNSVWIDIERLPSADTVESEDYHRIISLLRSEQQRQMQENDERYRNMAEYYTVWAHQIKTPISSMRLQLETEDTALSRAMSAELNRIEQYVQMVLSYIRLDSESTDFVFRHCDGDEIIRQAVRKFSGEFIARRLTLNYTPTHFSVVTDDKWFSFVMEQVLSNALKYTPSGTISIYGEGENTICVQDTGIGISGEDLPRIFEKGYTGLNGRADHRASGIGLYLCKRICEKMGITITVQSQPDVGTTVKMTFPEQL